ncbi:MAG: DUF805 domain-containing protein [Deltaproteobacteria bacterium]|jgi:uncharacterized membrane protein YhaH (DUF805 family)|nr:DUF805 domain-containing protein [Deltaproteobacteria bacterium]
MPARLLATPRAAYGTVTMNYLIHALKNPFTYTGRASRAEFWVFFLFSALTAGILFVLVLVAGYLSHAAGVAALLVFFAAACALAVVQVSVAIRRCHDIGVSGWLAALMLLMPPAFIVCGLLDGHYRTNSYGPKPPALDF